MANILLSIPIEFTCCDAVYEVAMSTVEDMQVLADIAHRAEHPECGKESSGELPSTDHN